MINDPLDYYRILGLNFISNDNEIKSAYYKIAKEAHPDILKKGTHLMSLINEAYEVLSNESLKEEIDKKIINKSGIVSILKGCHFYASGSAFDSNPNDIIYQGWLAEKKSNWFIFEPKSPVYFTEISAEALSLPYEVKRNNLDFVEVYRLYGLINKKSFLINEFKLLSSGDRDIFFKSPSPVGPFTKIKLQAVKAPSATGWKSLRLYGVIANRLL